MFLNDQMKTNLTQICKIKQQKYKVWCLTLLSTIFSYIKVVSFIGGGNQSTQRNPVTDAKI